MKPLNFRRVAVIAGTTVLAAGGGAYAVAQQSGGDDRRETFLNDTAERLDVSPQKLKDALKGAFFEQLDRDVEAGRIPKERADAIKERVEETGDVPFLGGPHGGPGFHRGPGGPLRGSLDAVAKYLGLSPMELHDQLHSGKSLADVAEDRDKSVDGLKDVLKKEIRAKLARAVEDKRLTDAQGDRMLGNLDERVDQIVERTPPRGRMRRGPGFGPHGGPGFGPPPGPPPGVEPAPEPGE